MSKRTISKTGGRNRAGRDGREVTRRDVLSWSAAGAGLLALGPLGGGLLAREAQGAPTGETFVVVLNQYGGNDGLNTVVPVTLNRYYDRREILAIQSTDGLSLDTGPGATTLYQLHPALANLAQLWADGDVAIVNKVGYPRANLSHFTSEDIYSYAMRDDFGPGTAAAGWVARYADRNASTALGAVGVGVGRPRDFTGGSSNPFLVDRLEYFEFQEDGTYPKSHEYRLELIRKMLDETPRSGLSQPIGDALAQGHALADQVQAAVGSYTSTVDYAGGANYAQHIQRNLRDIATLVNHGFETRIFYTGHGGFDTHGDQGTGAGRHADILSRMDVGVGAFAEDMKNLGVWDQTMIVVISEFGRRNYKNGSDGTDHGHGNCFIVIGGAVNGGMYGPDLVDEDLDTEYLDYEVDFRDIYREILQGHLNADPGPIFPEAQEKSTTLGIV